jgi:hypothetical protein
MKRMTDLTFRQHQGHEEALQIPWLRQAEQHVHLVPRHLLAEYMHMESTVVRVHTSMKAWWSSSSTPPLAG